MPKQGNNHGATSCPDEDDRAVEQAFLRLGNVLAEIANGVVKRKADISEGPAKNHTRKSQNGKKD